MRRGIYHPDPNPICTFPVSVSAFSEKEKKKFVTTTSSCVDSNPHIPVCHPIKIAQPAV
jgi:hypothetical protein